jgi:hypothetical protein
MSASLASFLAPAHLLVYSALLGTELYQTFVMTKVSYQVLPSLSIHNSSKARLSNLFPEPDITSLARGCYCAPVRSGIAFPLQVGMAQLITRGRDSWTESDGIWP